MTTKILLIFLITSCSAYEKGRGNPVSGQSASTQAGPSTIEIQHTLVRDGVPDLTQTDITGSETGDGEQYCAPASASNALVWLARHGYEKLENDLNGNTLSQLEIAKILGNQDHMNTNLEEGTNPSQVLLGLKNFLHDRLITPKQLTFQGWRNLVYHFESSAKVPNLEFIQQMLSQKSIALLNIGWYTYAEEHQTYERNSGHWVTLVGYERATPENPGKLVIHDPSPRAGQSPAAHHLTLKTISRGTLTGKNTGLPFSADGYYDVSEGINMRSGSDIAILDGLVVVQL